MIDKGQMLSRHDFSKVNWGILAAVTLLFTLGAALLLMPLLSNMEDPHVLALLQAGAATILLGTTLLALRHYLRPMLTYRLYEHGVRVLDHHSHKERFIAFEKIADIYHSRGSRLLGGLNDNMAFRTSEAGFWYSIKSNISHSRQLIETLIQQQIQQRGPLALNSLYQGEILTFGYLISGRGWLGSWQEKPTQTLRLSATTLSIAQAQVQIEKIHRLESNLQRGTLRLLDLQGNELFSLGYDSLFSADLFIALMEHMINNRIPAYNNPAMTRPPY
ncbi:hypothetical protein KGP17_20260 [Serratia sp. JSRIV001]|uniref:Uncharacterized protein n=1 Tax=Serratia fonticola TaxID=47917 RepID=A0AAW3WKQ9_SERFO|nr:MULTISPECIES: hypothetical protein [Serratia]MBC3211341.1 hypothetical protein [Serratia fonticola]NXZ88959.1 hypothetical protein [Serratia fonticola]NYA12323.1 hypothetical protein [Serratia fonticola]NYA31902.1 hypothetical protein [Serratia fonticola]QIP90642.1 putative membrane protein [Serratia fonticola]